MKTPFRPNLNRSGELSVLSNRTFLALWSTQAVTQTAQNVVNFSLLALVQSLTGSSAQVALIILSFTLPAVIFSTLAGVLVDRWDKQRVMVISTIVRGAAVGSFIVVDSPSHMPWVYISCFVFATAAQFFAPAEGAIIPRLVGAGHLIAANSLFNLTFMASQFLGFTVVGWLLIRTIGLQNVFIVVCIAYVCAAGVLALLRLPTMKAGPLEGALERRYWRELMEGWRFIVLHRTLLVTIAHLAIANSIYLVLATLGPAYVEIVLKIRVADLGVLIAPAGICTLLGFITMGRFARQDNRNTMIHYGLMGIGFSIMGLALIEPATRSLTDLTGLPVPLTTVTVLAVLISMNFGYWTAFVSVPAQTVLQENSPDEIRGRVLSTFFTVSNAVSFFPILLAGAIADWLGVLETMITIGIFILAIGALSHFSYVRAGRTWEPTPTGRSLAPDH